MASGNDSLRARHDEAAFSAGALVGRILAGDRAAETELVSRYARGVRVIVSRGSSDRTVVDDLCQETFGLALEKIRRGDVRDPERLSGFIVSLARNIVIEHFRRAGRRAEPVAGEADPAPSPLDVLVARERDAAVRAVLAELSSERDRQILLRLYVNEDTKAQICSDLGLSSLHFNRVLFRARERYRAIYENMVAKEKLR
jgi:RNA polymerase sigma-70 factor (ECF subfamily)